MEAKRELSQICPFLSFNSSKNRLTFFYSFFSCVVLPSFPWIFHTTNVLPFPRPTWIAEWTQVKGHLLVLTRGLFFAIVFFSPLFPFIGFPSSQD
jgi:hypothetical protein